MRYQDNYQIIIAFQHIIHHAILFNSTCLQQIIRNIQYYVIRYQEENSFGTKVLEKSISFSKKLMRLSCDECFDFQSFIDFAMVL